MARTPGAAASIGTISPSHTPASGSGRRRPRGLVFCDGNRGSASIRYAVAVENPAFAAAAQAIGLAIHELATNAGKYGALSVDAGRVDVGWRLDGDIFAMSPSKPNRALCSSMGFGPTVRPSARSSLRYRRRDTR